MGRLAGIAVLVGMIMSVTGSFLGNNNLKVSGYLMLLIIATLAGYRYLKFSATTPVSEIAGTCIDLKRLPTHYVLSFRTGSGIYSGQAALKVGSNISKGDSVTLKIKGPVILEINKK
ncbi:MAG: hypothetical protein WC601_02500 [Desulfotomaculaceae bacterium]